MVSLFCLMLTLFERFEKQKCKRMQSIIGGSLNEVKVNQRFKNDNILKNWIKDARPWLKSQLRRLKQNEIWIIILSAASSQPSSGKNSARTYSLESIVNDRFLEIFFVKKNFHSSCWRILLKKFFCFIFRVVRNHWTDVRITDSHLINQHTSY